MIVLVGVLLLGSAGIAVWGARSGSTRDTAKPLVASPTAPATTPAPSPPSLIAAPVAAPSAPAAPAEAAVAAPAAAPSRPEQATPAKMATAGGPGKLASSRIRPARASRARRTARVIPVPPETASAAAAEPETAPAAEAAPAPAAKPEPQPEPEPPAPKAAAAEPEPTPPAPASVDDLVGEAQHAWMAGHYAAAIGKAQAALKADPTPTQAAQANEIIATCSCAIGKADAARAAAFHLNDTKREAIKAMCEKNGVTIE